MYHGLEFGVVVVLSMRSYRVASGRRWDTLNPAGCGNQSLPQSPLLAWAITSVADSTERDHLRTNEPLSKPSG